MLRVTGTLTIEADVEVELDERIIDLEKNLFCFKVTRIDALHATIDYHAEKTGAGTPEGAWVGKPKH